MRLAASTAGTRTIVQAAVNNSNTIGPSTAFTDLLRLTGVNIHGGQPTRVSATGSVTLTGTTNTVRTVFFELTHGAGNTVLCGGAVNMANDEAATAMAGFFALNFIILNPPALATDEFALRWSTLANSTANVNGTTPENGGAVLNVEELTAANTVVGPIFDEIFFQALQANDPQSLLLRIRDIFTLAIGINPDVQLVDIVIAGGGAGQVFLCEMCFRFPQLIEDVAYPAVADLAVLMAQGPDWTSNTFSLNRIIQELAPTDSTLEFWANACGGDGAYWLTAVVYKPGVAPPPTLALRSGPRAALANALAPGKRGGIVSTSVTTPKGETKIIASGALKQPTSLRAALAAARKK